MDIVMTKDTQRKKIHPHRFTLWVALASIIMMFAGLTSAYIVKRDQPNWISVDTPVIFWYSTAIILISSLTIYLAVKAFRERNMLRYRRLMTSTMVMGMLFILFQIIGFSQLWYSGLQLNGSGAAQFLYVIFGLHVLHVLGGVVALLILFFRAYNRKVKNYDVLPLEIAGTYWHFVDVLWIYLFVFFLWIK
jgi:cytochrome c oxidase subunit 3